MLHIVLESAIEAPIEEKQLYDPMQLWYPVATTITRITRYAQRWTTGTDTSAVISSGQVGFQPCPVGDCLSLVP